jgi:hypothetical protein
MDVASKLASGGPGNKRPFLIESDSGKLLRADLEIPGRIMFGQM